jgi:hypothetical protein
MANPRYVEKLKKGVDFWNQWRAERHGETPNLSGADLANEHLAGINLRDSLLIGVNFRDADLHYANLSGADLRRSDLSAARLHCADLSGATLSGARLDKADLYKADLRSADVEKASIIRADLSNASLRWTGLSDAILRESDFGGADLRSANLTRADLTRIKLIDTVFGNTDLEDAVGLDTCEHRGRSILDNATIDHITLLTDVFLRGCGLPDPLIKYYLSSHTPTTTYYSCFISYASKDEGFVHQLHTDLQESGVRCWFAPEDMKIGDKIRSRIDDVIQHHDHLLLVLSENAIHSEWVEKEVETAFDKENMSKSLVLFPIRLDNSIMDIKSGWAGDIKRSRHIGDFRNWQDKTVYTRSFQRLLRDLKVPDQI